MAKINRSDVIQKAVNDLAISGNDKIPNETLDKVQLTYSLNKKFSNFVLQGGQSTSGTITITLPTISSGAEIFLTSIDASYVKDAICDIATGGYQISVVPNDSNVATGIIKIPMITLTAQQDRSTINLSYPLKLKAGSTITFNGTFTAGVLRRDISAVGFISSSN